MKALLRISSTARALQIFQNWLLLTTNHSPFSFSVRQKLFGEWGPRNGPNRGFYTASVLVTGMPVTDKTEITDSAKGGLGRRGRKLQRLSFLNRKMRGNQTLHPPSKFVLRPVAMTGIFSPLHSESSEWLILISKLRPHSGRRRRR